MAKRRGGGMVRLRRQVYKEISSGREDKWGNSTNYVQKSRNWYVRINLIVGMR